VTSNPVVQLTEIYPVKDSIRVFIRDCRVDLRVGIYESEMQAPQPVVITVEIGGSLPHHYQDLAEKKLDRVLDYEQIYNFICQELPKLGHIYLLETVAEQIINFCFQDIRVQHAQIRIEKTGIFPDAAGGGIQINRTRPAKNL
jgi:7,8-dihydroneopterin aldolase/epimerase/oxygenase